MSFVLPRYSRWASLPVDPDRSNRSDFIQKMNIFVGVMLEIKRINRVKSEEIDDLINQFGESYNRFADSMAEGDLISFYSLLSSLEDSIDSGSANDFFLNHEGRLLLRDEILVSTKQLKHSIISISTDLFPDITGTENLEVPSELAAPLRVSVIDDKIALINKQTHVGSVNYPAANRVRKSLHETLSGIVSDLPSSSNADQRYVRACERLLEYLSVPIENISIEALGLNYQLVSKLTSRLSLELGGSIIEEINHTLTGIGVLLNQFEEWQDYLKELSLTHMSELDSDALVQQAKMLAEQIEENDTFVDPRIAGRLKEMIEPVLSGLVNADTLAAPLIGSLSNYFGLLSKFVMETIPVVAELGVAGKMGASALLLTYAIKTLQHFCPSLSQFQPLKFVIDVVNWFTSKYSQIKDILVFSK